MGAAGIHFAVIVPHLNEYKPFGVFFLIVAWFQATWAVLVITSDNRRLLVFGLVVNTLVVAIWLWSRTVGLPIGPEPGTSEDVGLADGISTVLEAVIGVLVLLLLSRVYRWREPSRRAVVLSAVLSWAVVIALTAVAFTAEASGTNGH
jgi:hypothetical protein